ncbi:hypothetical protein [Leifsonia sp. A12D58]|uniref:hypothetical protein n=1 Tax=Leifsonia sp. A12D58 TaxID=3397674 RepID=UPI0039DFBCBB
MTYSDSGSIVMYLYWFLLLMVTVGSLVFAVLAYRLQKRAFAIASAGTLAAALFIAAVPSVATPPAFAVMLGLVSIALAVIGGAPMAVLALDLAMKNSAQGQNGGILVANGAEPVQAASPDSASDQSAAPAVHEVLRGGLTIGFLERFAVAGSILLGFPEGIAIVVAIKGVGRFTELSAPESRERFIIGTFASLIWACACAALVQVAIS